MFIALFFAFVLSFSFKAFANPACPVCTIAVGASLEIARRFGVADTVVGVWFGAFLILMFFWLVKWSDSKNMRFFGRNILWFVLTFGFVALFYVDLWGSQLFIYSAQPIFILYLDAFLFSIICGAAAMHYGDVFYQWMKMKNGGRAHFPFEKVVVPVALVAIVSYLFYLYPLETFPA